MGLDITAYRRVAPAPTDWVDAEGYLLDDRGGEAFRPWRNANFPGRDAGLPEAAALTFGDSFSFRAGSYGGYNVWREWLAALAGYPLTDTTDHHGTRKLHAAACWQGAAGPFSELINFADNEGTIGPVVSAKLARDFAEWDERAKAAAEEPFFYQSYEFWRRAFEMAADDGAVDFH